MGHDARRLARSLDGAELVIFDEARDLVVEWNGSRTFNVYTLDGVPVDCWSTTDPVADVGEAKRLIAEYGESAIERIRGGLSEPISIGGTS
jgi:hypothetical protein